MNEADLAFAGVAKQAELVRAKEVSAKELVETSLRRIERLDPQLNAFRSVYWDQAIDDAKGVARRLRAKTPPPLLGVPVAIKDCFDVAGDVTANGSTAYGEPAAADCEVVRRVRKAGAIIVGKTNLPALAIMGNTVSSAFGMTRNPWDTTRTTGGSSGGSAAAVASGMVPAALASDGAGSIRIPAAMCGLFGMKPQRDRISLAPFAEHWHGLSVLGWETRSVIDSALMLDVTAGPTETDPEPPPAPERSFSDAAAEAPGKLRVAYSLAVPPGLIGIKVDDDVVGAVTGTAELLRSLGHEVEERNPEYGMAFSATLVRYLSGIAEEEATLPHRERLERRAKGFARMGRAIPDGLLRWARAQEAPNSARINRVLDEFDALITPVAAMPPFEVERWEGRGALWTLNGMGMIYPWPGIWNQTGQPAASVPAGFTADGLPLAVQLIGRRNDEATLYSLAAQIQGARDWTEQRPTIS